MKLIVEKKDNTNKENEKVIDEISKLMGKALSMDTPKAERTKLINQAMNLAKSRAKELANKEKENKEEK